MIKHLIFENIIYLYIDNHFKETNNLKSIHNYLINNNLDFHNKKIYIVKKSIIIKKINSKIFKFIKLDKSLKNKFIDKNNNYNIIKKYKANIYIINELIINFKKYNNLELLKLYTIIYRTYFYKLIDNNIYIKNNYDIYPKINYNQYKNIKKIIDKTDDIIIISKSKKYRNELRYRFDENNYKDTIGDIQKKLSLSSNSFDVIKKDNHKIYITKESNNSIKLDNDNIIKLIINGYNYQQILKFYFPNTLLKKSTEVFNNRISNNCS